MYLRSFSEFHKKQICVDRSLACAIPVLHWTIEKTTIQTSKNTYIYGTNIRISAYPYNRRFVVLETRLDMLIGKAVITKQLMATMSLLNTDFQYDINFPNSTGLHRDTKTPKYRKLGRNSLCTRPATSGPVFYAKIDWGRIARRRIYSQSLVSW